MKVITWLIFEVVPFERSARDVEEVTSGRKGIWHRVLNERGAKSPAEILLAKPRRP